MEPISGGLPSQPIVPQQPSSAKGDVVNSGFGKLLESQLQDVNHKQLEAAHQVDQLATGGTDNIQETVMSLVEADMSLRMIVEIRNRLVDSYQELMRMQI